VGVKRRAEPVTRSWNEIGDLLTLRQAAEFLGRNEQEVRRMAKEGRIPYAQEKKGGKISLAKNDLISFLKWHNVPL